MMDISVQQMHEKKHAAVVSLSLCPVQDIVSRILDRAEGALRTTELGSSHQSVVFCGISKLGMGPIASKDKLVMLEIG
jgi:hypothetical protein